MKVFVWHRIDQATDYYHGEGGVVVFADTEERARELAHQQESVRFGNGAGCTIRDDEKPNEVREVTGGGEAVYIMPDAGCC